MYVRVSSGSVDLSKYDEIVAITEDVAAQVKKLPGFVSYQGGVDQRTGTFVAISVWETEEAANFSRDALGDVVPRLGALGAQLEPAKIYTVIHTA